MPPCNCGDEHSSLPCTSFATGLSAKVRTYFDTLFVLDRMVLAGATAGRNVSPTYSHQSDRGVDPPEPEANGIGFQGETREVHSLNVMLSVGLSAVEQRVEMRVCVCQTASQASQSSVLLRHPHPLVQTVLCVVMNVPDSSQLVHI